MIESVNIDCFGCFANLDWQACARGQQALAFKRMNIIYGRNYSGKTTLSRIVRCLETGCLPEDYENCSFTIGTDTGDFDEKALLSHNLSVRVYNTDFVNDHLGFLKDRRGRIKPFAVVGRENKEIQARIDEIEAELGGVDEGKGVRYACDVDAKALLQKQTASHRAANAVENALSCKATDRQIGIKYTRNDPNYTITRIKEDVATVRRDGAPPLEDKAVRVREAVLREVALDDIDKVLAFSPSADSIFEQARLQVAKRIAPTKPIEELLADPDLQSWVKAGIAHHRNRRDTCAFCTGEIPDMLWQRLDDHFNEDSESLCTGLREAIEAVEDEAAMVRKVFSLAENDFYPSLQADFRTVRDEWQRESSAYVLALDEVKAALQSRLDDIFTSVSLPRLDFHVSQIKTAIESANALIAKHAEKTRSLQTDRQKARRELILSDVARYIREVNLDELEKAAVDAKDAEDEARLTALASKAKVERLEEEKRRLLTEMRDESRGAQRINDYLSHFFGHAGLRLVAVEGTDIKPGAFEIRRGDGLAHNLSEGECSLVSFCYFMAKLEDSESSGKRLTVYIDDPVSSLDSNHIFFIQSLIESQLTRPPSRGDQRDSRYEQIFIATHNLEFLKYIHALSKPEERVGGTAYFIIESGEAGSTIRRMPKHIKQYATEFVYLFEQVYRSRDTGDEEYAAFRFGNSLRKFLESYLFFRYPNLQGLDERYKAYFGEDSMAIKVLKTITDGFSHLDRYPERSLLPPDVPEVSKLAVYVTDTMAKKDTVQYVSLLKSIGEDEAAAEIEAGGCAHVNGALS